MKNLLRQLFSPLLNIFENTSDEFTLTPTNRKVTLIIGAATLVMTILMPIISGLENWTGFIFPVLVFGSMSICSFVIGCLGSDHAVAKLLGNRKK